MRELTGLIEDPATLRAAAESHGVCVRPILQELVDTLTGSTSTVALPCGSTRANVCRPCADKARRLRMQQCREGWHREDDDSIDADPLDGHDEDQDDEPDECQEDEEATRMRLVGSAGAVDQAPSGRPRPASAADVLANGRQDPDLPDREDLPAVHVPHPDPPVLWPGRSGRDPGEPATYDYRSAALDAMHFSKAVDRLWQNLRRCAGDKVQYFSAVESQRRLAMHLHAAVRGIIPARSSCR